MGTGEISENKWGKKTIPYWRAAIPLEEVKWLAPECLCSLGSPITSSPARNIVDNGVPLKWEKHTEWTYGNFRGRQGLLMTCQYLLQLAQYKVSVRCQMFDEWSISIMFLHPVTSQCTVAQWVYSGFIMRAMLCHRGAPWASAELNTVDFSKIKELVLLSYVQ